MDNKTNQSIRTLENALNNENLDQIEFDLVEGDRGLQAQNIQEIKDVTE